MLPEDALVVLLHQSADYFQGLSTVIEDAFRGILVFILVNHLPKIICFPVEGVTEGGLELLFAPRGGVDSRDQVDGVLNSVGEGTATLLDEFEHHGGDPYLLRELGLGQSGDPPSVVQRMDFLRDTSWASFHLTKDTGNHYIGKMNDELINNPTDSTSTSWQNHQYLTREQVAEILQVTTRTVSEMTSKGIIVAIKLGTGKNSTTRYRKESLDAALKRLEGW